MNLRQEGYWDQHYKEELKNFQDNGDQGDVWFGEPLTRRIINKILQMIKDDILDESTSDIRVLDVGCGNAFLLCSLMERSTESLPTSFVDRLQLCGIDYAANSIELSKEIVESMNLNNSIHLQQCDFLDSNQVGQLNKSEKFDFIIDKGTFDAICLLSGDANQGVKEKYKHSVHAVSKRGTIFILASCNHTEDELLNVFLKCDSNPLNIELVGKIETPKIMFGGKEGSQVCCLVLKFI